MTGDDGNRLRPNVTTSARKRKRKRTKKPIPLVALPLIKKQQPKPKAQVEFSKGESLKLIQDYHTLNKKLEQNARDDTINEQERTHNADRIRKEQHELGGIEKYQRASIYGATSSKFVCAHWVEPLLKEHIIVTKTKRPRILDIGAIDNQYLQYDWFDTIPIDLNAQHKSVIQADFFDYAQNALKERHEPFDAIVLSLVLNFQGDPRKRGDMLALAADTRLLRNGGLVFVALPSASLDNSRYCDEDYLIKICHVLGLKLVERKRSAKLALLAFQQEKEFEAYDVKTESFQYLEEISRGPAKKGEMRNNFAVMLKNSARCK